MTHHTHEHAEPNYWGVWLSLLILTIVELWVARAPMPKAAVVAAYFMHLKFEKYALILIVMSPLLLSAILYIGLVPDATTHLHWLPPPPE